MNKEILAIYFAKAVTIGGHGYEEWLARNAKTSQGVTSVEVNYDRRIVTVSFSSGVVQSWTEVPFENVTNIVRGPAKEATKEQKK